MVLPRRTRIALTTATSTAAAAVPASLALVVAGAAAMPAATHAAAPGPELRILSPRKSDSAKAGTFTIDVSFRGRTAAQGVVAAEVLVDGVRWTRRELAGQLRGVLTLDLDGSTLAPGRHEVTVILFGADGTTSSKITVVEAAGPAAAARAASDSAAGAPASLAFRAPGNGARVSGVVDVTLDVTDKTGSGANPYVTFYVDKEFKTLKNYPPYSYSWDTTNLANGLHTIEATAFVDDNSAPATRRLQVYVDNAGGNTVRQPEIPDLRAPRAPAPAVPVTPANGTIAPLIIPAPAKARVSPSGRAIRRSAGVSRPAPGASRTPASAVGLATVAAASLGPAGPAARTPAVSSLGPDLRVRVRPEALGVRAAGASVTPPAAPEPRFVVPSGAAFSAASVPSVVTPGLRAAGLDWTTATVTRSQAAPLSLAPRPRMNGLVRISAAALRNSAATAATPLRAIAPLTIAGPKPAVFAAAHAGAATKAFARTAPAATPSSADGVRVAFNGQQIAFDVAPRVEAGLPLAPFRQIFEHTGGRVTWVAKTQVVRAVNGEREIVISLGKNTARVNDQAVSLSRPAFLEQGRTIVPLSFVGKALDVDVQYDSATGRLRITSKNK